MNGGPPEHPERDQVVGADGPPDRLDERRWLNVSAAIEGMRIKAVRTTLPTPDAEEERRNFWDGFDEVVKLEREREAIEAEFEVNPGCPEPKPYDGIEIGRVEVTDAQFEESEIEESETLIRRFMKFMGRRRERDAEKRAKHIEALAQIREAHPWIQGMPLDRAAPAQRAMLRVTRAFEFIELLVPKRLSSEEIGDAMELIVARLQRSKPAWHAYLKLATTILWILLHSVVYAIKGPSGSKKSDT